VRSDPRNVLLINVGPPAKQENLTPPIGLLS
jgi:hypothetical protein